MKSKYNRKKLSHRPFLAAAPAAAMLMLSIATDVFMIGSGLLPRLLLLAPTLIFGIRITAAQENPEYKIPWLLLSVALPITAIISYFCFYRRSLSKREKKMLRAADEKMPRKENLFELLLLEERHPELAHQAKCLITAQGASLYPCGDLRYFKCGKDFLNSLLYDIERAESFVYLEFYIIENGRIMKTIVDKLKTAISHGAEVRLLYDDTGSMNRITSGDLLFLKENGILAEPFSGARPFFGYRFNNRIHRKLCIIDGKIAYAGGINLADEYFDRGWRDNAIRITGAAVDQFTYGFLKDLALNRSAKIPHFTKNREKTFLGDGFIIPFCDGPRPIYNYGMGEMAILGLIDGAKQTVFITTPYLIIGEKLFYALERAVLRGATVVIVIPKTPDKKLVYTVSEENAHRLLAVGCRIFLYTDGFLHAKTYLADGKCCILGSINLDYRSLAHNFECGVWISAAPVIKDIERDIFDIMEKSEEMKENEKGAGLIKRLARTLVRIISPLL